MSDRTIGQPVWSILLWISASLTRRFLTTVVIMLTYLKTDSNRNCSCPTFQLHCVSEKDLILVITWTNVDRCSKFFHCHIKICIQCYKGFLPHLKRVATVSCETWKLWKCNWFQWRVDVMPKKLSCQMRRHVVAQIGILLFTRSGRQCIATIRRKSVTSLKWKVTDYPHEAS